MEKCDESCEYFIKIANTTKTCQGLCSRTSQYSPTLLGSECPFNPQPYRCKDCHHFVTHDFACMTADAMDLVENCSGFDDEREYQLAEILYEWQARGFNLEEKINKILMEMNADEFE